MIDLTRSSEDAEEIATPTDADRLEKVTALLNEITGGLIH